MNPKNMKKFLYALMWAVLALFSMNARAQSAKASATIDTSNIMIGDHTHLKLQCSFPAQALIQWPVIGDTLTSNIEVLAKQGPDTVTQSDPKQIVLSQVLTITCFDSGSFAIPPVTFSYRLKGDTTTYREFTQPVLLNVNTVAVDTTQPIKDIKEPLKAPLTLQELLPWIGGGLLSLAVIALIIYIIIRRKKKKPLFSALRKPALPAHTEALQALEKLRQERLWQQGQIKEYHVRISDIIRVYIEKRWNIAAPEMITPELIEALSDLQDLNQEIMNHLKTILDLADRVKFAKFQPLPDENDLSLRESILFIEKTADRSAEEKELPLKANTPDEQGLSNTEKEDHL